MKIIPNPLAEDGLQYIEELDKITEINKTDGYSNYVITENYKYTFTRDEDGIIDTITKEEV